MISHYGTKAWHEVKDLVAGHYSQTRTKVIGRKSVTPPKRTIDEESSAFLDGTRRICQRRVHVASHMLTALDTLTYVGMDFVPLLAAETLEVVGGFLTDRYRCGQPSSGQRAYPGQCVSDDRSKISHRKRSLGSPASGTTVCEGTDHRGQQRPSTLPIRWEPLSCGCPKLLAEI